MKKWYFSIAAAALAALLAACAAQIGSGGSAGRNDIAGTVTGPKGPEAGVWVIAETTDLPTKYSKIVVTDDRGRYLIPDLPKASYSVWVRGYGLVDSPRVRANPGGTLDLKAVPAPSAAAAAQYYPPMYWYSLLKIPAKNEFPIGKVQHQAEWLNLMKSNACIACHALGTLGTRTIPKDFAHMKSADAWARRVQSGQALTQMARDTARIGDPHIFELFGDWTDRIAKGELPFARPDRPQGIERNLVLTLWDWSTSTAYMHDLIGTDRRKPTLFPNGKLYGAPEDSTDYVPVLDPRTNQVSRSTTRCAIPRPRRARTAPCSPRRTGATSRSGTARPASTTR